MKKLMADFWLALFFLAAGIHGAIPRKLRGFFMWLAWHSSAHLRRMTRQVNGPKVLGPCASAADLDRYGKDVVCGFYDVICDMAIARRKSAADICAEVAAHSNDDDVWRAARAQKKGAIVVTAHFGSFEVGMAGVRAREEKVHVLFARDESGLFDRLRQAFHAKIGVTEVYIEDGVGAWAKLRDALEHNEVVVLQGDRVMPGHKGRVRPFLHGALEMPEGPVKLAQLTGAPLIPAIALRLPGGKVSVELGTVLHFNPHAPDRRAETDRILDALGAFFARAIGEHPAQWHVLHDAFTGPRAARPRAPEPSETRPLPASSVLSRSAGETPSVQ